MLEENGVEEMHQPEKFLSGGDAEMTTTELHSPVASWSDHVPPESELVTDQNLRYWMRSFWSARMGRQTSWGSTSSRMCGWRW